VILAAAWHAIDDWASTIAEELRQSRAERRSE